jgi:NAD kinase
MLLKTYWILNSEDNKALMDEYLTFLKKHKIDEKLLQENSHMANELSSSQVQEDLESLPTKTSEQPKPISQPYAIVVLGGGLTLDKNQKDIIVNDYTN